MDGLRQNYYGSLCTEMYEILHEKAPREELEFYLSHAEKQMKILEPLCGSGRFLVPFMERGFDISGMDLSEEMLTKLRQKSRRRKSFVLISGHIRRRKSLIIFLFLPVRFHCSPIWHYAKRFCAQ